MGISRLINMSTLGWAETILLPVEFVPKDFGQVGVSQHVGMTHSEAK